MRDRYLYVFAFAALLAIGMTLGQLAGLGLHALRDAYGPAMANLTALGGFVTLLAGYAGFLYRLAYRH